MKPINLISICNAKEDLSDEDFYNYLNLFGIDKEKKEQEKKEQELNDIKSLIDMLKSVPIKSIIFDSYYYGFKINQIGKEFDLLRFGINYVVNIELKSRSTIEKIKDQLIKNNYYLSFLNRPIYNFTYVSSDKKIYYLRDESELVEVDMLFLIECLGNQELDFIDNIHSLFNPSNYLISPFNSTDKFIEEKYFLTNQQMDIKKSIKNSIEHNTYKFFAIEGSAGTGKTLLAYDIAKEFISDGKSIIVIHSGNLNDGHYKLKNDYEWNIIPAKEISFFNLKEYDFIFVDEVQRMIQNQLKQIIDDVQSSNGKCIFSYDKQQCLSDGEIKANNSEFIEKCALPQKFKLTDKIRTNKEISSFIINLFDLYKRNPDINYSNIKIQYFSDANGAIQYMRQLNREGWKIINYTPSLYETYHYNYYSLGTDNAHRVIGQEYDKVVAVIDDYFGYSEEGKLGIIQSNFSYYYNPIKMLFQILTRARSELTLIIINNKELLKQCIHILKNQ